MAFVVECFLDAVPCDVPYFIPSPPDAGRRFIVSNIMAVKYNVKNVKNKNRLPPCRLGGLPVFFRHVTCLEICREIRLHSINIVPYIFTAPSLCGTFALAFMGSAYIRVCAAWCGRAYSLPRTLLSKFVRPFCRSFMPRFLFSLTAKCV